MARITSTPICTGPVPIARTRRSATAMPTTTPPMSSTERSSRRPMVAPRQITAAIEANTGRSSPVSSPARYQAATAAPAV